MKSYDQDFFENLMELRLFAYEILKRVFYSEPTKEFMFELSKTEFNSEFPLANYNAILKEGLKNVDETLKRVKSGESEKIVELLVKDYTEMFIGPGKLKAPPWESAYLTEERLLFQENTLDVRNLYLKCGYVSNNYPREADDHIALELDFMRNLIIDTLNSNDAREMKEYLQIQKHFLQKHLIVWTPFFAKDMMICSKSSFFNGIANILEGFLILDLDFVSTLEESLDKWEV